MFAIVRDSISNQRERTSTERIIKSERGIHWPVLSEYLYGMSDR